MVNELGSWVVNGRRLDYFSMIDLSKTLRRFEESLGDFKNIKELREFYKESYNHTSLHTTGPQYVDNIKKSCEDILEFLNEEN